MLNTLDPIISVKHRAVVLRHNVDLAQAFMGISNSLNYHGESRMVIPHNAFTHRVLKERGVVMKTPLESYYNFNGGVPFGVQIDSAAMLTTQQRAYLLNAFGTGKTRTALWSADFLIGAKQIRKALVVAPLSTLQATWAAEAFKTCPGLRVSVLHGDRKARLRALDKEADIYVINHDGVATILSELRAKPGLDLIILDELATYRNGTALRTKNMGKLCSPNKWVWGLTGSPMPNGPEDVWSQCRIITPWTVPSTMRAWRDKTMVPINQFTRVPKPHATDTAFAAMQPSRRYTLDDVVELPDVVIREIKVEQTEQQKLIYTELSKRLVAEVNAEQVEAINEAAKINKLLQVSCGAVYTSKGAVRLDCEPRIEAVLEAVNETRNKVIVFANYKHAVAMLHERFEKEGIAHFMVTGDTSSKERGDIFHDFQSNPFGPGLLVAHPQCMAHGLTLTSADTIIWYGPTYDLEIFDQANARIRRVGQKHKQQVLLLCGTRAESVAYARLQTKQKMQNALLDMLENNSRNG